MSIWIARLPKTNHVSDFESDIGSKRFKAPEGWKFHLRGRKMRLALMEDIVQEFEVLRLMPTDKSKDVYWNGGLPKSFTHEIAEETHSILKSLCEAAEDPECKSIVMFVWYLPDDHSPDIFQPLRDRDQFRVPLTMKTLQGWWNACTCARFLETMMRIVDGV